MPFTNPSTFEPPEKVIKRLNGANIASFISNFFAQSGTAESVISGVNSNYAPGPWQNGISLPGKITINIGDVTATANANPNLGSWNGAYYSIILHELGHAFYATTMALRYTTDPAKKLEWCYEPTSAGKLIVISP